MDMNFLELAAARYSVRKFRPDPVEPEKLNLVLRAGHLAPTACNLQPQRILVLTGAEALEKLRNCTTCHFNAPAALLVCYDRTECWKREYDGKSSGDIDASIVTTHMMLEAASLGIGSTWVMHFSPAAVREEFEVPEQLEPTAILVLGYPAEDAKPSSRHTEFRPLEELVVQEHF